MGDSDWDQGLGKIEGIRENWKKLSERSWESEKMEEITGGQKESEGKKRNCKRNENLFILEGNWWGGEEWIWEIVTEIKIWVKLTEIEKNKRKFTKIKGDQ